MTKEELENLYKGQLLREQYEHQEELKELRR
jgi:hypothetical protein